MDTVDAKAVVDDSAELSTSASCLGFDKSGLQQIVGRSAMQSYQDFEMLLAIDTFKIINQL